MKKIKIAQIGTSKNGHGGHVFKSLVKQTDIFDVVGYALPENERQKFPESMEVFNGYQELSVEEILQNPDIEAVAVETEEIYLTKYAIMVAEAGKQLHMEKPGGTDYGEFEKLIKLLKEKSLVFSTGYMYRFNPKIKEAIQKIQNGDLGEIYCIEAHMDCFHPTENRAWMKTFHGGMMFYLGCHLVDLIYRIQGEPCEVIPLNCATGLDGVDAEDYGMVVFRYPNGISFAKACAAEIGGFLRRQLVICGSRGTIELKPLEAYIDDEMYTVANEYYDTDWHKEPITSQSDLCDRYDEMMRNFALLVRGEKENEYSYDYELNLYKLLLKACGEVI